MSAGTFDLEGLLRAVAIGLGVGLIGGTIGFFVMRQRAEWTRWKPVLIMGTVGVILLLAVVLYYAWPSLVTVPSLDGLSQAEAEQLLVKHSLIPEGRPQYTLEVEAGRVVPHSQSPNYGLPVRPGTIVSFAISVREDRSDGKTSPPSALAVTLFQPKGGEKVLCSRGGDNIYRLSVKGTSSGLSAGRYGLLLWLRPVKPPSDTPGWYLQRPPANGVNRIEGDGSWIGAAQVGNAQYPPREGDVFDLAVSLADNETINKLMAEPGVVLRNQPVGVKSDTALGVVATLR